MSLNMLRCYLTTHLRQWHGLQSAQGAFAFTCPLPWAPSPQLRHVFLPPLTCLLQRALLWPRQTVSLQRPIQLRVSATHSIHVTGHDANHPWASACDPFYMKIDVIMWHFWILMGGPCLPPLDKIRYMTANTSLSPPVSLSHPLSYDGPYSFSIWDKTNEGALHWVMLLSYKSLLDAEYQKVKVFITQSCLALCDP